MVGDPFGDLSLRAIMSRWPETIRVFIRLRLHCVGCPISSLHDIGDAAREHGRVEEDLRCALGDAVGFHLTPEAQAVSRRQSAADDADP